MVRILALVPDVMFGTRIEDTAKHLGYRIEFVGAVDDKKTAMTRVAPSLVVVALDAPRSMETIQAAKEAGARVLAFGSHKNIESIRAAKAAGADQVVARSQMAADLPNLLKKLAE